MLQLLQPPLHLSSPAALPSDTFSIYSLCVQSSPWGRDAWSRRNAVIPADPTSCTLSLRKWKKKNIPVFPVQSFWWCGSNRMKKYKFQQTRICCHQNHLLPASPGNVFSQCCPSLSSLAGTFPAVIYSWKNNCSPAVGGGGVCLSHHHFPLLAIDSPKKAELNSSIWFAAYMSFYLIFQCVW